MISPLALVKVNHKGTHLWRVLFTTTWLQDRKAQTIVLLREPTEGEMEVLKKALPNDETLWMLDELLVHAMLDVRRRARRESEPPL